jgi:hypothetical protein
MKNFKKNIEGFFICEECGKEYKTPASFGKHITTHFSKEEYFKKWIKESQDGICEECGKETKILKLKYNNFCSKNCVMLFRHKNGYKNEVFSKDIVEKVSKTCLKRYGVEHISYSKKFQKKKEETNLLKYGFVSSLSNPEIRSKRNQTCLKRYGKEEPINSLDFQEKSKKTCLKKYGVEHYCQSRQSYEKSYKTGLYFHRYKNIELFYQASYELDFLNKYYDKFPDIQRGPSIKYIYKGKNKIYFPDFYISSLNLIIEIKSSYFLKKDLFIKEKKKATLREGFKYLLIIDKNYEILENGIISEV